MGRGGLLGDGHRLVRGLGRELQGTRLGGFFFKKVNILFTPMSCLSANSHKTLAVNRQTFFFFFTNFQRKIN